MTHDERVALIESFTRAWRERDLDALMALMAEDCEFRSSTGPEPGTSFVGRDEVRRGFRQYLAPSDGPEPESESEPLLIGPGFALARWVVRQRHPDGSTTETRGCDVFEFEGGRIRLKDTYRKISG